MNEIELSMMRGMVSVLNAASEAYYNGKTPLMSDEMFDMRLEDLRQFEEETGFVLSNSPTQRVGSRVLNELNEVTHTSPMLSLDKCHNVTELLKFINNKETVASIKLDGLTCRLTYEDGILVRAETRGDGYSGSDVTEHVKHFLNVPMKIDKTGTYTVDGEAIITDEDFAEINKNNEYKNSRNLASGTLAVLDTSLVAKRRLRFMLWDVIEGGSTSLKDNLNEAKKLYFDVVPFWFVPNTSNALNPNNLQSNIDYVFEFAKNNGFPCDGAVFKFDDVEYGRSLGATSHHFRNGIAYKAKDEVYRTKLLDIEYSCGKSGVLTPVAIFEPVDIDGSTINRSTVHNISILYKLDLHIGDTIEIYKANAVIPAIKRNVSADERMALGKEPEYISLPAICPVCGGKTKLVTENSSTVLVCTNDNCKGKLLGKLTHFVSKNAMNIEGMSEATLEFLINNGWVKSFEDLYDLNYSPWICEWKHTNGYGKKSVENILNAIESSRNTTLDKFIYSLSIPLIGKSASKTISKFFDGDFDLFYNALTNPFDWTALDDFGDAMNDSIVRYSVDNCIMVRSLARKMSFEKTKNTTVSTNLSGLTFCITGSLVHFANRDEAKEKIEAAGGKVSNSVSKKTNYLVCNQESGYSKSKKAKELGVEVIDENELIKMLN